MTALAERGGPERQQQPLRVALSGLRLAIGRRDNSAGFEVTLTPESARQLAIDLLHAAERADLAGADALGELYAISSGGTA